MSTGVKKQGRNRREQASRGNKGKLKEKGKKNEIKRKSSLVEKIEDKNHKVVKTETLYLPIQKRAIHTLILCPYIIGTQKNHKIAVSHLILCKNCTMLQTPFIKTVTDKFNLLHYLKQGIRCNIYIEDKNKNFNSQMSINRTHNDAEYPYKKKINC